MNLLRFLVIALAGWLVISFMQRMLRQRRKDTLTNHTTADMVRCVQCGLHLPKSEALAKNDNYFCSQQHLERDRVS